MNVTVSVLLSLSLFEYWWMWDEHNGLVGVLNDTRSCFAYFRLTPSLNTCFLVVILQSKLKLTAQFSQEAFDMQISCRDDRGNRSQVWLKRVNITLDLRLSIQELSTFQLAANMKTQTENNTNDWVSEWMNECQAFIMLCVLLPAIVWSQPSQSRSYRLSFDPQVMLWMNEYEWRNK